MATIKISIIRKQKFTKKGKKFYSFITKMKLPLIDENGNRTAPVEKWVQVRFNQEVNLTNIKSGTIYVDVQNVNAPSVYKISTKKEVLENGVEVDVDVYPCCWVRKIEKFIPYTPSVSQSAFVTDDTDEDDGYSIPDEQDYSQYDE